MCVIMRKFIQAYRTRDWGRDMEHVIYSDHRLIKSAFLEKVLDENDFEIVQIWLR